MQRESNFVIARDALGAEAPVTITQEEFEAIGKSRSTLLQVLFVEEKFDILIENFLEFEGEALLSSARHMIHRGEDFIWFAGERGLFNRRLVNLMGAARAHIDAFSNAITR